MAESKGVPSVAEGGSNAPTLSTAMDAIQSKYPQIDGQMIVRQVSKSADTTWYRVNWYKKGDFGMYIHHSRFLALKRSEQGLVIEDQTVKPRGSTTSLN